MSGEDGPHPTSTTAAIVVTLALQQLVQRVLLLLEETTPAASHSPPIAQLRLLLVGGVSYAKESLSSLADNFKSRML